MDRASRRGAEDPYGAARCAVLRPLALGILGRPTAGGEQRSRSFVTAAWRPFDPGGGPFVSHASGDGTRPAAPAWRVSDNLFQVPPAFDYVATVTWASSGALVGIRKHFDVVGVFVIALVSALGSGFVRDALFLQRMPVMLTDPLYLPLIAVTVILFSLFSTPLTRVVTAQTVQKLIDIIDAVGIPIFAVIGMQLAEGRDIPVAGVIFVGVVNGTGGGLLRDVLVRDVPAILRPGQFVSLLLLLACVLFVGLKHYQSVTAPEAAWIAIGTFFVLRVLTLRFNWTSRSVLPESPLQ